MIQVDLVSMNPGVIDIPFEAPSSLTGQLETATDSWPVTLESTSVAPQAVASGGFAVRRYRLVLPERAEGRAVLTCEAPASAPLHAVLMVQAMATSIADQGSTSLTRLAAVAPASSALARTFAGRFLPNQPIYFVYGSGSEQAAKFQLSFDYRLATLRWGRKDLGKVSTLRLGYTQRSLWDIDASSSPFYDTSYMPEIAIVTDSPLPETQPTWFTWLGLRAGYQHESNGRDGMDSRSLNRAYLRARFIVGSLDSWFFVVLPEVHTYVGSYDNNPHIKDYRGYGQLQLYFGRNDGPTLRLNTWGGKDFDNATYQLDLTYPLNLRWLDLKWFMQAQYFNGHGESLRSYDRKSDAFRLGVGLVR